MRMENAIADQWDFLNNCSRVVFGQTYWNLSDKKRSAVHAAINDSISPDHGKIMAEGLFKNVPGIHNGQFGGYPHKRIFE